MELINISELEREISRIYSLNIKTIKSNSIIKTEICDIVVTVKVNRKCQKCMQFLELVETRFLKNENK